jgi:hypothetical protein
VTSALGRLMDAAPYKGYMWALTSVSQDTVREAIEISCTPKSSRSSPS